MSSSEISKTTPDRVELTGQPPYIDLAKEYLDCLEAVWKIFVDLTTSNTTKTVAFMSHSKQKDCGTMMR